MQIDRNGFVDGRDPVQPADRDEVDMARAWILVHGREVDRVNDEYTSYTLKHRAEDWCGRYIGNGAFIIAAIGLGYRFEADGINARFNMADAND